MVFVSKKNGWHHEKSVVKICRKQQGVGVRELEIVGSEGEALMMASWFESRGILAKFLFSWLFFVDYSQVKTGSHQGHPEYSKSYIYMFEGSMLDCQGFFGLFFSDFKFWYDFVKTPHKLHQSPWKVWFHQCCAAYLVT